MIEWTLYYLYLYLHEAKKFRLEQLNTLDYSGSDPTHAAGEGESFDRNERKSIESSPEHVHLVCPVHQPTSPLVSLSNVSLMHILKPESNLSEPVDSPSEVSNRHEVPNTNGCCVYKQYIMATLGKRN